jgi:hypothetical protein
MTRIIDCVVATNRQNGWPDAAALMTLGWITFAGGDYNQETTPEKLEHFKEQVAATLPQFNAMIKGLDGDGFFDGENQEIIPLAPKAQGVEAFVLELVKAQQMHPAVAMEILGLITYAGGDLKKQIHLATLSAHMGKAAARHGYRVELTKMEDQPLNITGGKPM